MTEEKVEEDPGLRQMSDLGGAVRSRVGGMGMGRGEWGDAVVGDILFQVFQTFFSCCWDK